MTKLTLDPTDVALLALLRDDARAPTAELARKLALSRTTVQSRMEKLRRQRVITGYTVVVPDELEAELVRAHVLITLAPKRSGAIETALRRIPELRVLHSVSGPRWRRAHDLGDRAVDADSALSFFRRPQPRRATIAVPSIAP